MLNRGAIGVLCILALTAGCIELQALLSGLKPPVDGTPGNGIDGPPSDDGPGGTPFAVSLSVSNPTPQVNEEVFLTCEVAQGDAEGVTFDFQPSGRLAIDASRGVARFIVQETDIGQSVEFTCSGRNAAGESDTSSPQTITPSM